MIKEAVEKRVALPEGFKAEIDQNTVSIKGQGKEAKRQFKANGISFRQEENSIVVVGKPASRKMNILVNTISSHITNMASGLKTEYTYKMEIVYSHFPMNVAVKGNIVEINNFVGEKKARTAKIVEGASVTVKGKEVIVKSPNKETAGQTAANIEGATRLSNKDRRIYQDGIFIAEKATQEKAQEKQEAE